MNETKQFKIETPIVTVESDSGNHLMDVATVMLIIMCLLMFKKVIKL